MANKYFIVIAKEKYDCWYQEMDYLGMYDCFSLALEEVINNNKKTYVYGLREFDYYIFISNINEKVIMAEKDCIYSFTSGMRQENIEYVKEEYQHYLHNLTHLSPPIRSETPV
jgi:hypothetical protein